MPVLIDAFTQPVQVVVLRFIRRLIMARGHKLSNYTICKNKPRKYNNRFYVMNQGNDT